MQHELARCECFTHKPSALDRPILFLPIIFLMFVSFGLVFVFGDVHGLVELFSVVAYSAVVILCTFSAQKGQQPYFFECPIVRRTTPQLLRRHGGFLLALLAIEAISFYLAKYLPASWLVVSRKNGSPFGMTLCLTCLCLAFGEILSDRVLLKRAHLKHQNMR